jgi:hypothetical protein
MSINDKYKVSFVCNESNNWISYSYVGNGFVYWDTDRMKISLTINASASFNDSQAWMEGSRTFTPIINFDAEYINGVMTGKLNISSHDLRIYMEGAYHQIQGRINRTYGVQIGGSYTGVFTPKSASELNASSRDTFGDWTWNQDRTKISLKSVMSENKFVIWNYDGLISWSMEMGQNTRGVSETTTDTNDRLVNFSISFDGASPQLFGFIENRESTPPQNFVQLDYGVYNRFLGQLDRNSTGILNQMKDKAILILQYKEGNINKTDMFILEGLETILEYLNQ